MYDDLLLDAGFTTVQRALGDFQAGNPVVVTHRDSARLALSIEALTPERLARLRALSPGPLGLAISATKARLQRAHAMDAATLALKPADDCEAIAALATAPETRPLRATAYGDRADAAVVELAKLCQLLPAAVTLPLAGADQCPSVLRVAASAVMGFRAAGVRSLKPISRARVALRLGGDSEFIVFRDGLGATWTAVVIGAPDLAKPVAVRLHSSCLTGDSFGSLRCDCGDQLRMSLEILHDSGGVLLYLDQEGCGIGLANKMRAYALQDTGLDTIDANTALGFESDERRYDIAARMLELLGIREVFLLTNNPGKVSGLAEAGIEIMGRIPLIAPVNCENRRYLDAKARRAGHLLDEHTWAKHAPGG